MRTRRPSTIGILGAGNIVASMHLPTLLAMKEVKVAWVADCNAARARRIGRAFGVPALRAVVPDRLPHADVVLMAIPYGAREPYYEALRHRGVALYVEKPLARTVEQHLRYCEWFGSARVAVGFQRRSWGAARLVKSLLASGAFGHLREVRVGHGRPGQLTGSSYSSDFRIAGGGMLFEVGVHWVDLALQIADVRGVRLVDGRMIRHEEFDIHTEARFSVETATGAGVPFDLLVSGLAETRNTIEFQGEHVTLVLHQGDGSVTLERDGRPLDVVLTSGLLQHSASSFQLCHAVWRGFLDALSTDIPNWTSAGASLLTTQVLENLYGLP